MEFDLVRNLQYAICRWENVAFGGWKTEKMRRTDGGAGERTSPSHSQRSNMGQASSQLPEHQLEQLSIESGREYTVIIHIY
ncbi:hypothetical protein TELCIR_04572 [Teladorsagia circumcincta]|uniref:Uncharacterized protein n=1 Tax=Teladorsagia circumcincta TaxID=45464 RepID=A0A2G9UT84_TELCI|nr:hypothetical protein TELCIR_04572 [Teladorsagia circumcincta]